MQTLEELIEEEMAVAVERVVRLSQRAAVAAFERQFRSGCRRPSGGGGRGPDTPRPSRRNTGEKPASRRRSKAEIIKLSDRLLNEICADPGQPMAVLAPRVGVRAAELLVPMARLKAGNQVKTVGQRHLMRYFPVAAGLAA